MLRLNQILSNLPTKTFEKNDIIFDHKDVVKNGYIVISGIVTIYSLDRNGIERRLSSSQKYELIPNGWLCSPNTKIEYNYRAYTKCVCAEVDRDKLHTILLKNPEALFELLLAQDMKIKYADNRIETLIQSRAEEKVLFFLKYISARISTPTSDGFWVETNFSLTQSEIANALGITRETATSELHKLEKMGVLSPMGKGKYLINKRKLTKLIEKN